MDKLTLKNQELSNIMDIHEPLISVSSGDIRSLLEKEFVMSEQVYGNKVLNCRHHDTKRRELEMALAKRLKIIKEIYSRLFPFQESLF